MIRERLCEFFPGLLLSSSFNESCFQILGRTLWMEYLCIETPLLTKNDINTEKTLACMHSITEIQIHDKVFEQQKKMEMCLSIFLL